MRRQIINIKFLILFALLTLLVAVTMPLAAAPLLQDEVEPPPGGFEQVAAIFTAIENAIRWASGTGTVALLTLLLTAVAKFIPGTDELSGRFNIIISGVLVIVLAVAQYFGQSEAASEVVRFLEQIAPLIATFITSIFGASLAYNRSVTMGVPVLGRVRTPQAKG